MESSSSDQAMGGDNPKEPVYLVVMAKKPFNYMWFPTNVQDPLKGYAIGEVLVMYRKVFCEGKKPTTGDTETAQGGSVPPKEASESPFFFPEGFNPGAVPIVDFVPEDSSKLSEGLGVVLEAIGITNDSESMSQVNAPHGACFVVHQKSVSTSGERESECRPEEVLTPSPSLHPKLVIPETAEDVLQDWLKNHADHPFPSKEQMTLLERVTNLKMDELLSYFTKDLQRYLYARGQY